MQHAHESIEQGHAQARIILHRALLFFQQAVKALSENRTIAGKNVIGRVGSLLLLYSVNLHIPVANVKTLAPTV